MLTPPPCPAFIFADAALFARYQDFIGRFGPFNRPQGPELDAAHELAAILHRTAMDQGMSKLYELSPDIYWLDQCAAIVECIAAGKHSDAFTRYAKSVLYWKCYPSHVERVNAFIAYADAVEQARKGSAENEGAA